MMPCMAFEPAEAQEPQPSRQSYASSWRQSSKCPCTRFIWTYARRTMHLIEGDASRFWGGME
eukprot:scaffold59934_cov26-Attheya_sp.AAC.1